MAVGTVYNARVSGGVNRKICEFDAEPHVTVPPPAGTPPPSTGTLAQLTGKLLDRNLQSVKPSIHLKGVTPVL